MKILEITQACDIKSIYEFGIAAIHEAVFNQPFPEQSYEKKANDHKIYVYGYYESTKLVGYTIVVDQHEDKNLYAWYGGLLAEYQGRGVTIKMFDVMVQKARELGYNSISLATTNRRPNMLRLAIKYGFDIVDIKKRETGEGNKVYFKYYIRPESHLEINLNEDGKKKHPVEIEPMLVNAHKNNCTLIRFVGLKDEEDQKTVNYAMHYCQKFVRVPKIEVELGD